MIPKKTCTKEYYQRIYRMYLGGKLEYEIAQELHVDDGLVKRAIKWCQKMEVPMK